MKNCIKLLILIYLGTTSLFAMNTEVFSPSNSSSVFLDKLELLKLLRTEKFKELETTLVNIQSSYEKNAGNENIVMHAFLTFAILDPELEQHIDRWIEVMPDSFCAHNVKGIYVGTHGYVARGGKFASETSSTQFKNMHDYFQVAKREYKKAIELHPRLSIAYANLIHITAREGALHSNKREQIDNIFDSVKAVLKKEELTEGQTYLKNGLTVNPDSYYIRVTYLDTLVPKWGGSLGEMEEYLKVSRPYYHLNPLLKNMEGKVESVLVDIYTRKKQYEKALYYNALALQKSDSPTFYMEKAYIYMKQKKYDLALENYKKVLANRPQLSSVYYEMSKLYFKMRRYSEAFTYSNKTVELEPYNPEFLRRRGYMNYIYKKYSLAIKDFEKSLIYSPNDDYAIKMIADASSKMKKL